MNSPANRPAFGPYAWRGAGLVLLATAITAALHHTWFIQRLELTNLDALFVLFSGHTASNITIVEISDDDYGDKKMFSGVSPLKPTVIGQLIQAIDSAGAQVIGVDVLTADWPTDSVRNHQVRAPVVWVQGVVETDGAMRLEPVMGGNDLDLCEGPPALEQIDGMIRRYFPRLFLNNRSVSSFTTVLKQVAQDSRTTCKQLRTAATADDAPGESNYIAFIGGPSVFQRLSAGDVLAGWQAPEWSQKQILKDRIVLLGGAYRHARDRYATPVGEMYGVEILANILASEMTNATVKEAGLITFIIADLLLGLGIITIAYYLHPSWSLPATFLGAPILGVTLNMLLFAGWRYYLSFMPMVVGVVVHSIVEHVREHRHLLREHTKLQERHASLQLEAQKWRSLETNEAGQMRREEPSQESR